MARLKIAPRTAGALLPTSRLLVSVASLEGFTAQLDGVIEVSL